MNMSELTDISGTLPGFSEDSLLIARRTTLSSYYNMTLILCGLIFVIVNSTTTLARNALFFAKTLPFEERAVSLAFKLFQLLLSFILFNLIFIIAAPGLKLLAMPLGPSLLTLVSVQVLYIALHLLIDLLFSLIAKVPFRYRKMVALAMNTALVMACMFHLVKTRFAVDAVIAHTDLTLGKIAMVMLASSSLLLALLLVANLLLPLNGPVFARMHYLNVPIRFPSIIAKPLATVMRSRLFASTIGMTLLVTASTMYYTGVGVALQNLVFILPMWGIVFLGYCDATLSERPMLRHLHVSAEYETVWLLVVIALVTLPAGIVGFVVTHGGEPFAYGISIALSSGMLGFLFPRSKGSMNETVSTVLSIITIILLTLLININMVIYPVTGLLIVMIWRLIAYETRTLQ